MKIPILCYVDHIPLEARSVEKPELKVINKLLKNSKFKIEKTKRISYLGYTGEEIFDDLDFDKTQDWSFAQLDKLLKKYYDGDYSDQFDFVFPHSSLNPNAEIIFEIEEIEDYCLEIKDLDELRELLSINENFVVDHSESDYGLVFKFLCDYDD